jgi:hypothetical protein
VAKKKTPAKKVAGSKKSPPKAATKAKRPARWSLGVFDSASHEGTRVVAYTKKDGTVMPYLAPKVKTKRALFCALYRDMPYHEARAQVLKDAAKAGVK